MLVKSVKRALKTMLIIVLTFVIFCAMFIAWFEYSVHYKRTTIFKEKHLEKPYELIVTEIGSALVFSPSDVELTLKQNGKEVYKKNIVVSNDGKTLTKEQNFKVEWQDDKLIVTAMGEEQEDEIIEIELEK